MALKYMAICTEGNGYVPCQRPAERGERFCIEHLRAFREILFGILIAGPRRRVE